MQYIVVFQPKEQYRSQGPPADFATVESAEQAQAKVLYKSGVARQLWAINTKRKGAIGLFESSSDDELQAAIRSFPMVQKDYTDHVVYPVGAFAAFAE